MSFSATSENNVRLLKCRHVGNHGDLVTAQYICFMKDPSLCLNSVSQRRIFGNSVEEWGKNPTTKKLWHILVDTKYYKHLDTD